MIMEVDTNTIATVIIACFGCHYVVMTLAINNAVNKLGKVIAEKYLLKEEFHRHLENEH